MRNRAWLRCSVRMVLVLLLVGVLGVSQVWAFTGIPPLPLLPPPTGIPPLPPEARTQILVAWTDQGEFNPTSLYTLQTTGEDHEYLASHVSTYESHPCADSAGNVVYVAGQATGSEVYWVKADRSVSKRITNNSVRDAQPTVSPAGSKIAFIRPDPGNPASQPLWVSSFAPNLANPLPDLRQLSYTTTMEPCFSPDGNKIVAAEEWVPPGTHKTCRRLRVWNLSPGPGEQSVYWILPESYNTFDQRKPSWSPDGRLIALSLEQADGSYDLALAPSTGGNPTLYTSTPDRDEGYSSWNPQEKQVVFEALQRSTRAQPQKTYTIVQLDLTDDYRVVQFTEIATRSDCTVEPHPWCAAAPCAGVLSDVLPEGQVGTAYRYTLRGYGGEGFHRWELQSGSTLPRGLSMDSWGVISGTPQAPTPALTPHTFTVILRDKNNTGAPTTGTVSIVIQPATTLSLALAEGAALPIALVGQPYRFVLPIAGGTPPYRVSVSFYQAGDMWHPLQVPNLQLVQITSPSDPDCGKWAIWGTPQTSYTTQQEGMSAGSAVAGAYRVAVTVNDSGGLYVVRNYSKGWELRILMDPEPAFYGFAGGKVYAFTDLSGVYNVDPSVGIPGSSGLTPTFKMRLNGVEWALPANTVLMSSDVGPLPAWSTVAGRLRLPQDQHTVAGELEITVTHGPNQVVWLKPFTYWRYDFRHNRGFQHENYTSHYTWSQFESFFGSDDCEYAGLGVDTVIASFIFDYFVAPEDGLGSGTCFGMSLAAQKVWNGVTGLHASPPPAGTICSGWANKGFCTEQHLWQLDQEYLEAWCRFYLDHENDMGRAALQMLRDSMRGGTPQWPYLLAMAYGLGSAHTVVPYAIEDQPDGTVLVRVYDPNKPFWPCATCDDNSAIRIDPRQPNRWDYQLGPGTVWGDCYLVPVRSEICQGDPDLISNLGEALNMGVDMMWYILAGSANPEQVTDSSGRKMFKGDGRLNLDQATKIPGAGLIPMSGASGQAGLFFVPGKSQTGAVEFRLRSQGTGGYEFGFFAPGGALVALEARGGGAASDTLRCTAGQGVMELTPGAAREYLFRVISETEGGGRVLTLSQLNLAAGQGLRLAFDGQGLLLRLLGGGALSYRLGEETASSRGQEATDYGGGTLPPNEQWRFVPGFKPGEPPAPLQLQIDRGLDGVFEETQGLGGQAVPPGGGAAPPGGGATPPPGGQAVSHRLQFQIGSTTMLVDGQPQTIDVPPTAVEGRTYLAGRWIVTPLGGEVSWDAAERKMTCKLGNVVLELWVGKNTARLNGQSIMIDPQNPAVVPLVMGGRTMLPMRFVGEKLGCSVGYDAATRTITMELKQ